MFPTSVLDWPDAGGFALGSSFNVRRSLRAPYVNQVKKDKREKTKKEEFPTISPLRPQTAYEILDVPSDASQQSIRSAWRNAVLKYHPDKHGQDSDGHGEHNEHIHRITQAWNSLRDPLGRETYDRELRLGRLDAPMHSHSADRETNTPQPMNPRTVISLSLFTSHYSAREDGTDGTTEQDDDDEDDDEEDEPVYYTYPCRCSALFVIRTVDLEQGVDVIGCDGCGDWIGVGYETIIEQDED
ncbi:Molecular chaperone (DnaJ superfamily) [Phaffia rhodozyma]|uniref:Diphthamide biosynthesis protein 4 n=1 Tax=Phaffia rhodozyma TaxID=264483 RepID=A0A0F7SL86_PHARH|nr:Molecular chaperone (DnaJ superfamily) [Phaffia rhodozyma]